MKLYKMKSLQNDGFFHVIDMMIQNRIYLANRENMNDIDEGMWNTLYLDGPVDELIEKGTLNHQAHQEFSTKVRKEVEGVRFSCFLESIASTLMWAHYADGFRGVALAYDLDESVYDIRKIDYEGLPNVQKEELEKVISGEKKPQDFGILKSKEECWDYEDEWRIYGTDAYITDVKPSSIIIGVRSHLRDETDRSPHFQILRKLAVMLDIKYGFLNRDDNDKYNIYYPKNQVY